MHAGLANVAAARSGVVGTDGKGSSGDTNGAENQKNHRYQDKLPYATSMPRCRAILGRTVETMLRQHEPALGGLLSRIRSVLSNNSKELVAVKAVIVSHG